ncbi:MAG: hypothetical protein NUW23_03685 [Firmicutes bacterium]|jgi:ATP-dependent DNA helicase RecQ|nr:hypothetical protein [Bacillota bacterium]
MAVLECVDSISWHVGRSKIARILKGSTAQDITKLNLTHVRNYGEFRDLSLTQIESIIDQLIQGGYLRTSFGRRPIVLISSAGKRAMATGKAPEVQIPDQIKLYTARERCRRCPYNPVLALTAGYPDESI